MSKMKPHLYKSKVQKVKNGSIAVFGSLEVVSSYYLELVQSGLSALHVLICCWLKLPQDTKNRVIEEKR